MNKDTKIVLLSLIAIVQLLTLAGGFLAYQQMAETIFGLQMSYKALEEKVYGNSVDFGIIYNPFSLVGLLALLGLLSTAVLLFDQVRHKNTENGA